MSTSPRISPRPEVPGYRLEQPLGERGSATIYRARRLSDGVDVALQLFDASTPTLDATFAQLEGVRSTHVARVLERGRLAGARPYWVLESLEQSVSTLLAERGVVDVALTARLGRDACAGLADAHRAGLVHGAIGPGALYLVEDGGARVAAFGAQVDADPYRAPDGSTGAVADLYALGAVLLELVTGAAPGDVAALAVVAPPLRDVLQRCLASDASTRFASADELGAALAAVTPAKETLSLKTPVRSDARGTADTMRHHEPVEIEPTPPRPPGTVLGSYRLVELLGEGGMGRVYLAEHARLGRRVAIKLLREELGADPQTVSRFFAEARAVNRIEHENIVEITDFIEKPGGDNYYIMEFLPGQNLDQVVRDDPAMTLSRVLGIVVQVCSALGSVHEAGIVHRDLKPENIFLTERGGQKDFVKLLDFGIAKLVAGDESVSLHTTGAGIIMGTPEYMSPEQASGVAVDARSDIYALGIILYELITGQNPFPGANFGELLMRRMAGPPPAPSTRSQLAEAIPAELDAVVLGCLERDREQRITTIREVETQLRAIAAADAYELEAFTGQRPPSHTGRSPVYVAPPPRSWVPVAGAAAALLALGIGGALWQSHRTRLATPIAKTPATDVPATPPVIEQPAVTPHEEPVAIEPDEADAGTSDRAQGKGVKPSRRTTRRELNGPMRHGVIDPFK